MAGPVALKVGLVGLLALVVLMIWKSVDDWAARTAGRTLGH